MVIHHWSVLVTFIILTVWHCLTLSYSFDVIVCHCMSAFSFFVSHFKCQYYTLALSSLLSLNPSIHHLHHLSYYWERRESLATQLVVIHLSDYIIKSSIINYYYKLCLHWYCIGLAYHWHYACYYCWHYYCYLLATNYAITCCLLCYC